MSEKLADQREENAEHSFHKLLARLLVASGSGDQDAFRNLTQLCVPTLRRIISSYCGDDASADDILQDALISIWRHASSFNPTEKRALPWLVTITRSRAVDWLRRCSARSRALSTFGKLHQPKEPLDALELLIAAESEALLLQSIASIDPKKRESIRLHYIEGFSISEVATLLGCPIPTIKSRTGRGIKEIRALILRKTHPPAI